MYNIAIITFPIWCLCQGSAPSSAQGSRIDLTSTSPPSSQLNRGSAIYLGCSQPRTSNDFECSSSNFNISPSPTGSRASIRHMNSGSLMQRNNSSQRTSPNVSPKHSAKTNSRIKPVKSSDQSTWDFSLSYRFIFIFPMNEMWERPFGVILIEYFENKMCLWM